MKVLVVLAMMIAIGFIVCGAVNLNPETKPLPRATFDPTPTIDITPTPTPMPTLTPTPTPEPTPLIHIELPSFPCNSCDAVPTESMWGYSDGTKAIVYVCPTSRKLQDRDEVKEFMVSDRTQGHICLNYAVGVIRNAAYCGIEAHLGVVVFSDYSAHSFISFPTTEDGDVWVDPTGGDWWVYTDYGRWTGVNMYNESQTYGDLIISRIYIE